MTVENFNWVRKPVTDKRFKKLINAIKLNSNFEKGPWIAGGCVRKMWQNLDWHNRDVDIFFNSRSQFKSFIDSKVINTKASNDAISVPIISRIVDNIQCYIKHESDNAITYKVIIHNMLSSNTYSVQAIKKCFFESASDVVASFDFTVCQMISDGNNMWATPSAIESLEQNKISVSAEFNADVKPLRAIKYMSYGFEIDDTMYINMLDEIETTKCIVREAEDDY